MGKSLQVGLVVKLTQIHSCLEGSKYILINSIILVTVKGNGKFARAAVNWLKDVFVFW